MHACFNVRWSLAPFTLFVLAPYDRHLLEVLHKRLQQDDCRANGWLLDGFPHTAAQAAALEDMQIQPDKVRGERCSWFFMWGFTGVLHR
jgi:hypothetical protein